jgi:uncharacterized protein (DUF488 family)
MSVIYTVGYEGTTISSFVAVLTSIGITMLADVRAVPISRKKGFSKNALRLHLAEAGIEYRHFVDLGDPKEGRDAARRGEMEIFKKVYTGHLKTKEALGALANLEACCTDAVVCMMCFERDPAGCHRTIIAGELARAGLATFDLYADDPQRYVRNAPHIPSRHYHQGLAAAE